MVPILDIGVWVEEERLPAPVLEDQNLHTKCEGTECLPVGDPKCDKVLEEGETLPPRRLVPQIPYQFYTKPSAAKPTLLSISANQLNLDSSK